MKSVHSISRSRRVTDKYESVDGIYKGGKREERAKSDPERTWDGCPTNHKPLKLKFN